MQEALRRRIEERLRPEYRSSNAPERGQFVITEYGSADVDSDFLNRSKERFKRRMGPVYPLLTRLASTREGVFQGLAAVDSW